MIKNECEIVRDLMPNYIENQISDGTKEFVKEHIIGCKECKEILESLEVEDKVTSENGEIDFLKKYNKKMTIFKVIAAILSVIILAMWTILGLNYIGKRKEEKTKQYILEIIDEAYLKIEDIKKEIMNGGNYKIIEESSSRDFQGNKNKTKLATFYKDFNYKEENNIGEVPYTNYGVILGKDERNYIQDASVQINSELGYIGGASCGVGFSTQGVHSMGSPEGNPLFNYYKYIPEYSKLYVINEEYDGKEYYIIREKREASYIDTWIRKEDMLLVRRVYVKSEIIQNDTRYTWEANSVTDEDVRIKDDKAYEDLQNAIKEFKEE